MSRPNPTGRKSIEGAYPLSPMQEGLLFHSLSEPGTGLYVVQHAFRVEGIDVDAWERGWQGLVQRHSILRTAFAWEGLERPLQVVGRQARLPTRREDWRARSPEVQEARLAELLAQDRHEAFDLSRAPLLRLLSIRVGEEAWWLVLTFHHLLLDGWSMPLLLQEALASHAAWRVGGPPSLPERRPYRDYIAWLEKQDVTAAEHYWRRRLGSFRTPTVLGMSHAARPVDDGERHGSCQVRLSETLTRALRETARENRLTLNTVVQGAWALALSRYSGARDVVYGTVVSGRPPELEGADAMLGLFINTLPVRVLVEDDLGLVPWLRTLQEDQAEQRRYEHTPLVRAEGWSGVGAGRPLFESVLAFESFPVPDFGEVASGSVRVDRALGFESTHYPLTLAVKPDAEMLVRAVYDRHRIDDGAAERVAEHLRVLLAAISEDPSQKLADLPILGEDERRQVLAWSGSLLSPAGYRPVLEDVRSRAAEAPDAVAVEDERESVSRAELGRRASGLAEHLRALGVRSEDRVAVFADRSVDLVVAALAVLEAGAAYVPLDPFHPSDRIAFLLEDADVRAVLVPERLAARLPETGVPRLDPASSSASAESLVQDEPPKPTPSPESLAYVIYTSGSTGQPKGVEVTHAGLASLVAWHQGAYALGSEDRATLVASPAFDASVWELWPALAAGASVHVPAEEERRSPSLLRGWLAEQRITVTFLPTPLAEAMLQEPWPERSALRALLTGGDRLHPITNRGFTFRIVNHYGPTESTVVATSADVVVGSEAEPSIGRAIDGTGIYLLDDLQRLPPLGVPGEICITGAGLARGYLGRADLTAERFVPNPFAQTPGERLYRTGDMARWRLDGHLEFLGRRDAQLKVRGHRVEPGEIESALVRHPLVGEAAVVGHVDGSSGTQLVAYVVPAGQEAPAAPELKRHLESALPGPLVPAVYVTLASLPLGPNGKVDRTALPAPTLERPEAGALARGPVEQGLGAIWTHVLGRPEIGLHDDFFESGGHSLLAARVVSQVRRTFEVELPLRAVFEHPTVASLAQEITNARLGDRRMPPLVRRQGEGAPLSYAQHRLWLLDRLEPGSRAHNLPVALALDGPLDAEALDRALVEIVARHEVLRTTFVDGPSGPVQQVQPPGGFRLELGDLGERTAEARDAEVRKEARENAAASFDLESGPLLRARLLRLGPERHVLLLAAHHIVSDGWSAGVFVRELGALYRAFSSGDASPLPDLEIQYSDFARWQRDWLQGEALNAGLEYWRENLRGLESLELPTDHSRPPSQTYRGSALAVGLSPDAVCRLRVLCRREGVTPFMVLMSGFAALLQRWSGRDDFAVATPVANRSAGETEGLIGFFVNTLVIRHDLSAGPSFRELLRRTREVALGAYDHQDLPFDHLVSELNPVRDPSRGPLGQVALALQNATDETLELDGLTLRPLPPEVITTRFDIELHWRESADAMSGLLVYNADLWEPTTMARMAGHQQTLLEAALANLDTPIADLPLLGADEERTLLAWSSPAPRPYPASSIPDRVAEQIRRNPDAVAVSDQGTNVTYAQLGRRSGALARHLRSLGVGRGDPVGLCLERSSGFVVGMLGILEAGAAYVPLDPTYPSERLAFMVEDAGVQVLVTEAGLEGAFPVGDRAVVRLEDLEEASLEVWRSDVGPTDLAYVMYTSGSTGRPKGVGVTHEAVLRLVVNPDYVRFGPGDVVAQASNISFDAATFEVWGALVNGARLAILDRETVLLPRSLAREIERQDIDILFLTTALFNQVAAHTPQAFDRLRCLLFGGEAVDPRWVLEVRGKGGPERLLHVYGPTENTTFSTWHPVDEVPAAARTVPIGRAIASSTAYVLDPHLDPTPIGVPGDLFVGGDGLARGYLGRPGLTAERFIPNPFGEPGSRLYRTGDVARWSADGTLDFLGRRDHQVKLRGFRIELGEIEAGLVQMPSVRSAAVVVREDAPGDRRLVAYVVSENGVVPTGRMRQVLRRGLPEYMVPSAIVTLDALPLTPNGKLDRGALPKPDWSEGVVASAPPSDETEETIASIWRDVLQVDKVSIHDNFFDQGGHSLLLLRLHERLREAFDGTGIGVVDLFEHSTVAAQAARIRGEGASRAKKEQADETRRGPNRLSRRRQLRAGGPEAGR